MDFEQDDDQIGGANILPDQWAALYASQPESPERKLLLSCLEDSLRIIQKSHNEAHRLRELGWVQDTSDRVFGFEWVCMNLGFSVSKLRATILSGEMGRLGKHSGGVNGYNTVMQENRLRRRWAA